MIADFTSEGQVTSSRPASFAKMSSYKLYYFNFRGRGEICRLAFAAANIDYEDIRLSVEDWVKEKASEWRTLYSYIAGVPPQRGREGGKG